MENSYASLFKGMEQTLGANQGVLQTFLETVGGTSAFETFREIVHHNGPKEGGTLWGHVMNGLLVLHQLRTPLRISDEEQHILYMAYALHDINKYADELLGLERLSFRKLATREHLIQAGQALAFERFVPDWKRHLDTIQALVNGHSPRTGYLGNSLLGGHAYDDAYNRLLKLIQAVDELDNSTHLEEPRKKDAFLSKINELLPEADQVRWLFHRLSESRGLLSNVVHNCIVEHLASCGALPLLFYAEGVAYLWPQQKELPDAGALRPLVSQALWRRYQEKTRSNFSRFVRVTNQGIKVEEKLLEIGVSFPDIWSAIREQVARKGDRISVGEKYYAQARERADALSSDKREAFYTRFASASLPRQMMDWHAAELIRTYYIFLATHQCGTSDKAWQRIYRIFGVVPEDQEMLDLFDARYARPYYMQVLLEVSMDAVMEAVLADQAEGGVAAKEPAEKRVIQAYVERQIHLSWGVSAMDGWGDALMQYQASSFDACSFCGSALPTIPWSAGDAPVHVKPQQFSNRRPAGATQADLVKKAICPVCRIQFLFEKLADGTRRAEDTYYLHLFPVTFFTQPFLQMLQRHVEAVAGEGADLLIRTDEAIRRYEDAREIVVPFRMSNSVGLVRPLFSEVFAGHIPWAVHAPGENESDRFRSLIVLALLFHKMLGVRVVLSKQPVPPVSLPELKQKVLYVDGYPPLLHRLMTDRFAFDVREAQGLWNRVVLLESLSRFFYSRSTERAWFDLVRALDQSCLGLLWTVDRLAERKASTQKGSDSLAGYLVRQAVDRMLSQQMLPIEEGTIVSALQELAELAWKYGIRGRSLERSSLQRPLMTMLNKMETVRPPVDLEDLKAALVADIFMFMDRTSEYRVGRSKREQVAEYVSLFFQKVVHQQYGGSLERLLRDRKLIQSAYLAFMYRALDRSARAKAKAEVGNEVEKEGGLDE